MKREERYGKQDHQSSHSAHLEYCISSHSHRAKLILRQFRAVITSKAVNPRPKQIENRHRSQSPMPRPILFPSASLPFPASTKAACYPHPKISNNTSSIKDRSFFSENHVRCLWHSFFCHLCPLWCLENQNPVGELWNIVETRLTPLIPNQTKQITHKKRSNKNLWILKIRRPLAFFEGEAKRVA